MEKNWENYRDFRRRMLQVGFNEGDIFPYDEKLISKLRTIYDGGIPASIILLSNHFSNGRCYDNAYLLSKAFLDTDDDIKLVYASIDSLRLNPDIPNDAAHTEHCFLERTMEDGRRYVYDTSAGYIFDANLYYAIEHPIVNKYNTKEQIVEYAKQEERYYETSHPNIEAAMMVIPEVEKHYDDKAEKYSMKGVELLQREVELFKEKINYNKLSKDENIKKLILEIEDELKN